MIRRCGEPAIGTTSQNQRHGMIFRSLIRNDVGSLDARRSGMVIVKFPSGQRPIASNATLDFDNARGSEIRPSEFFLASPNYLHWTSGRARQTRGFDGSVAGVLSAIRGTCVRHDHAHAALRQMENVREFIAVGEWSLRAGPDREFPIGPLSHCSARLQRSMRDVRDVVRCVKAMRRACQALFDGTFLLPETIFRLRGSVLLKKRKDLL